MPELPEVETVARQLDPVLRGRRILRLRVMDPKLNPGRCRGLSSLRVKKVFRLGKQVLLAAHDPEHRHRPAWLAVHLRMTGRLVWQEGQRIDPGPHGRAVLDLEGGGVRFVDTRRFGTLLWHRRLEEAEPRGVDPLAPEMTAGRLEELLEGSGQQLKVWLLRQDRLVGLGNIYASEILHRAGLSPFRAAGSLGREEIRALRSATRRILLDAIENCGTTFSDFQDTRGELGSYQHFLAVYGRDGESCRRCAAPVERAVQAQRSTYYCPQCQG